MRPVLFFFIAAISTFRLNAQPVQGKLDSMLNKRASGFEFNGVALVAQNGKLLLSKGYGFSDQKKNKTHNPKNIFQIGSITKQFTAVAVLKLQEE